MLTTFESNHPNIIPKDSPKGCGSCCCFHPDQDDFREGLCLNLEPYIDVRFDFTCPDWHERPQDA